jgi:hypothetical protein
MSMACKAIDDVGAFKEHSHKEMMEIFAHDHAWCADNNSVSYHKFST